MFNRIWMMLRQNPLKISTVFLAPTLAIGKKYYDDYLEARRDTVTIGLYSIQRRRTDFHPAALAQMENIRKIKKNLTAIARNMDRTPPRFVVSVYMIPDWQEGSNYTNSEYLTAKEKFFDELSSLEESGVILEDFYNKKSLTTEEKGYLESLIARGSNADMIKTHAIICPENEVRRHLQLDSNILIFSFDRLYKETFGYEQSVDAIGSIVDDVAMNASYYSNTYVSAHNKIVYTAPGSKLIPVLRETHLNWCREHGNDHLKEDHIYYVEGQREKVEKINRNSPYSKVFAVALEKIGLTTEKKISGNKTVYPACMEQRQAYRLTGNVILAVNQSWKTQKETPMTKKQQELIQSVSVPVGDADCNYPCYLGAIKKYTGHLVDHTGSTDYDDSIARAQLLELSDPEVDDAVIKNFYREVEKNHPEHLVMITENFKNTERGNELSERLFGCKVPELMQRAQARVSEAQNALDTQDTAASGPSI